MKISKNFDIRELVPKEIWDLYGEKSVWFIDPRTISFLQELRDILEELYPGRISVNVNTWYNGGSRTKSGYRMPNEELGAKFSQHKFGRAVDIQVFIMNGANRSQMNPVEVNRIIFNHEKRLMDKGLTTVENVEFTKTWNHLDCRPTNMTKLLIVNP